MANAGEVAVSDREFEAMERLARSTWGHQGCGRCGSSRIWMSLVHQGLARPVNGEKQEILSLTLKGFRTLEAMRWEKKTKP